MYARKVRIYPTEAQVALFNKCIGASRYIYNKANEVVKQRIQDAKQTRFGELDTLAHGHVCCVRCDKRDVRCECATILYTSIACLGNVGFSSTAASVTTLMVAWVVLARLKKLECWVRVCSEPRSEASRWFCTKHDAPGSLHLSYSAFLRLENLRPLVMAPDSELVDDHPEVWQKDIPYDTRQGAVKELVAAYDSGAALKRAGIVERYDVSFKSKKAPHQTFHCRANAFNVSKQVIFATRLKKRGKLRIRKRTLTKLLEEEAAEPHKDFVVQKTAAQAWYLCLPRVRKLKEPQEPPVVDTPAYRSVFLDPGVRTFQTFYSPDGVCGKIGDGFCTQFLDPLAARIDVLSKVISKMGKSSRTRMRLRRRRASLYAKITSRVDDLHWKTCRFLCLAFGIIFLPPFGTRDMVRRPEDGFRVISNKTANNMLQLSHGRFMKRLEACARTKHRQIVVVPEAYTTKTCGVCGMQNPSVGGAKVFHCVDKTCGYAMDRDFHGARNICISTLSHIRKAQGS